MVISVYITCKDITEAKRLAKHVLERRLAACANLMPIESLYWMDGEIVNDREVALILKSDEKKYEKLKEEVKKLHSYTIPCICKFQAEANKEYTDWITKEVR